MIRLILEFYLPAILVATVLMIVVSFVWLFVFLLSKKSKGWGMRQIFVHDLIILNLLIIPILSFAILALMVVFQSR